MIVLTIQKILYSLLYTRPAGCRGPPGTTATSHLFLFFFSLMFTVGYVFAVVQAAQYRRLAAIKNPYWVEAMTTLINSKKSDVFRWHDSGDVQDEAHLLKIFEVCKNTPSIKHWMPTREAWTKKYMHLKPDNLVVRFSATMVDQEAPASWPNTSTVSTTTRTCPAPDQDNECKDCRACWDPNIKNITYGKH